MDYINAIYSQYTKKHCSVCGVICDITKPIWNPFFFFLNFDQIVLKPNLRMHYFKSGAATKPSCIMNPLCDINLYEDVICRRMTWTVATKKMNWSHLLPPKKYVVSFDCTSCAENCCSSQAVGSFKSTGTAAFLLRYCIWCKCSLQITL